MATVSEVKTAAERVREAVGDLNQALQVARTQGLRCDVLLMDSATICDRYPAKLISVWMTADISRLSE